MIAATAGRLVAGHAPRAAAAKLVTLPVSAVLAFGTSRIVIERYGLGAYGVFALILAAPALLPSRDLGLGARVTDVLARQDLLSPHDVEATVAAAVSRIAKVACVGVALVVGLQQGIGWARLLGNGLQSFPGTAVTISLALFLLALPAGISGSVLQGLRRNDVIALLGPLYTLGTFVAVVAAVALGLPAWTVVLLASGAYCAVQWLCFVLALSVARLSRASVLRLTVRPVRQSFRGWAMPAFVIATAMAAGYQTDRLVLSHVRGSAAVAQYSVAAQLYLPLLAVITSAGYTLWGKYARERHLGDVEAKRFWLTSGLFALAGVAEAIALAGLGSPIIAAVLDVHLSWKVCAAFGVLLALQAAGLPVGMLLTDRRGLTAQAVFFSAMVLANVWLSIRWAHSLGVLGPVLASALTYGALVMAPSLVFARRYLPKDTRIGASA